MYFIASIINGKIRTPKIEAHHRLIQWFNNKQNNLIIYSLGLDKSYLESNAWLSGFIDTDGKFYSQLNTNKEGICNSIKYYMRISQRKTYHRTDSIFSSSYLDIINEIKLFLLISNVTEIERKNKKLIILNQLMK